MKKGFTLVEMLAILVILSIASIITYTGIATMNKNAKEKEYEEFKKDLYMAAETYIELNDIDVTEQLYVNVSMLLDENYIDDIPVNPKTEVQELGAKISVKKDQAGVLIFEYVNE